MICHGRQFRRYLYDILYFMARICPITYLIATIVLTDGTTDDASETLIILKEALNVVIMPAASALFFIRLRAVYSRNNYMTAFFGFWLLVILAFFLFDSARVIMQRSEIAQLKCYWTAHYIDAWGYIATAAYDTLMYFSISWQLASFAVVDRWQDRLKLFVTGNGLGWLSKVLLQSGQMYYFMTIGFSLCTTIFIFNPATHSRWSAVFIPPNLTVASVMACRIFRELKLGLIVGPITGTEGAISKLVFKDIGYIPEQHSEHTFDLAIPDDATVTAGIGTMHEV
ncbi:hypothetical protein PILCRDRAFT_819269 [Piloderma croceum F 1598]|uniref:Uncharacterized protein n=1 Tax=Piloderma croceum (strain F 1598) TaxID=765440 RepID=A0A0C3FVU9_PILCF|nr:hypothetical protein PILCRDRAFT_819269 [Piloderma croceum F 1598]